MRDRLFSFHGVESGKKSMVSVLLAQAVFLGIFIGAFDITAHSLFLSNFDEKMMARGYVVSGIAGIILTSLFVRLRSGMQFQKLAVINLVVVTSITIVLWIALIISPAKWVIFIVFIMLGPLNILALLGFSGTTGRLFTVLKGKRLPGLVEAGMIIGIIISCYSIPVLLSFRFEPRNFLLISASSVLAAAIIQIMIGARLRVFAGDDEKKSGESGEIKSVLKVFRKDRFTGIMGLFIALSVVSTFFVQYSFMAVTRVQYPSAGDLAGFLGIFTGSMAIFILLVKLLVFPYLIRNYGLRTCLAISPVLLAALTAIVIISGMFMGYTPGSVSGFLFFFVLLGISRLVSRSLKDSIESPSFKVICQTIDEKERSVVRAGIDGAVNEIAVLASGILLVGLGVLSFINLIHFSFVLFFIILIWIFVAFRLYKEYRKSIRKELDIAGQKGSYAGILPEQGILKSRFSGYRAFRTDYFKLISGDYSGLENNSNKWYFEKIIDQSRSEKDTNLLPVLKKITANQDLDEEIRRHSAEITGILEKLPSSIQSPDEKIAYAKKTLSGIRSPQTTEILKLLRDNSVESKRLAIHLIGKFRLTDMLPEVCECLNIHGLETDASYVLRTFGDVAEDELIRFYLISSGNTNTSKTILRLLAETGTKENPGFLFSRLWSNSRQLKEVALNCLIACEFKPSEDDKERLHQLISDITGLITWNLSAKRCLEKNNDTFLLGEMNKEISRWNKFLFNLLSVTYDPASITMIRENLEKETVESVNYALEMIDIVIDDSLKAKIVSLLDNVTEEEKLKNLYQFFPGEVPEYNKLLEDIINRDYNFLSLWTKACTLRDLPEFEGDDIAESVIALLFSPEVIIQEESARLIARSSRELYRTVSQRIPDSTKQRLDKIINGETNEKELLYEKIRFLSNCFSGIPEEELLSLAANMKYAENLHTVLPLFSHGCLVWPLSADKPGDEVYIHYNDQMKGEGDKFHGRNFTSFYILPFDSVEEFHYHFPDKSFEIFKYIDNKEE